MASATLALLGVRNVDAVGDDAEPFATHAGEGVGVDFVFFEGKS